MTKRKVTGYILDLEEKPVVGAHIVFDLMRHSIKNSNYYVSSTATAITNTLGYFEKELWCNEEGDFSTYYVVRIEDEDPIRVILPLGTANIPLSTLEVAGIDQTNPQYTSLLTYITANSPGTPTRYRERFTVDANAVSNGGVTLAYPILLAHTVLVNLNGISQSFGFDFNINGQKVNISGIGLNDILEIIY